MFFIMHKVGVKLRVACEASQLILDILLVFYPCVPWLVLLNCSSPNSCLFSINIRSISDLMVVTTPSAEPPFP